MKTLRHKYENNIEINDEKPAVVAEWAMAQPQIQVESHKKSQV